MRGRLRATGWAPRRTFEDGLAETVEWYRDAPRLVGGGEERRLPRLLPRMYGDRLRAAAPSGRLTRRAGRAERMRVLLTGASGFAGPFVAEALVDGGHPSHGPGAHPPRAARRR